MKKLRYLVAKEIDKNGDHIINMAQISVGGEVQVEFTKEDADFWEMKKPTKLEWDHVYYMTVDRNPYDHIVLEYDGCEYGKDVIFDAREFLDMANPITVINSPTRKEIEKLISSYKFIDLVDWTLEEFDDGFEFESIGVYEV